MVKLKPHAYGMKSTEMFFYKAARLLYEKLQNGLLDRGFLVSKVDLCLFMYKTVMFVVYVYTCLFWARSQPDIDNAMKYFKEDGPS